MIRKSGNRFSEKIMLNPAGGVDEKDLFRESVTGSGPGGRALRRGRSRPIRDDRHIGIFYHRGIVDHEQRAIIARVDVLDHGHPLIVEQQPVPVEPGRGQFHRG